jgi:hypothetical protein
MLEHYVMGQIGGRNEKAARRPLSYYIPGGERGSLIQKIKIVKNQ